MQEAFFFGPSDERQLFAIYHPPVTADSRVLTVICPPLFSDFARTHGALRKLANILIEKGQHVLRFDYCGTGDSFGRLNDTTVDDWKKDISLAVQEGQDVSGCDSARVLAVRASALLACSSVGMNNDVERLVLWDPVRNGADYFQSLRREQQSMLERNHFLSSLERNMLRQDNLVSSGISNQMLAEIRSLDSTVYSSVQSDKLRMVVTSSTNTPQLKDVSYEHVPFACNWETKAEDVIMYQPVLEGLTLCLTRS